MSSKVLVVYPHPDDETYYNAGTLIRHARAGDKITLICATMGQMGRRMGNPFFANRETLAGIRERELNNACKKMDIKDVRMWKMQDKTLQFREPSFLANQVLEVIKEVKPEILYTFYPEYGVHPDHDALSKATVMAVSQLPKAQRPTIYGSVVVMNPEKELGAPDIVSDVSDVLGKKMDALSAHASQTELDLLQLEENMIRNPGKKEQYIQQYTEEKYWIYQYT